MVCPITWATIKSKVVHGRCPDMPAVDILKATKQGKEPVQCGCRWGAYSRHMANTIEPSMCGGDGLMSNGFDHSIIIDIEMIYSTLRKSIGLFAFLPSGYAAVNS